MSERNPTTKDEAAEYIRQTSLGWGHPCKYGHFGCATHDGGPCADELAGQFNLDGEDES